RPQGAAQPGLGAQFPGSTPRPLPRGVGGQDLTSAAHGGQNGGMRASLATLCGLLLLACGGGGGGNDPSLEASAGPVASPEAQAAMAKTVGYDLRRLRPVKDEPLDEMFARLSAQARAEDKQV